MKMRVGLCVGAVLTAGSILAAAVREPRALPGSSSSGNGQILSGTNDTAGATNLISLDQLASKLQELHASIEEALPLLTQFNQQTGNTNGLAGAISGIISGLKRDPTNSPNGKTSGQKLTNVLSALGALVSTNKQGAPELDQTSLRRLVALEEELKPVAETIRQLNLAVTNSTAEGIDQPRGGLSPTGRQ